LCRYALGQETEWDGVRETRMQNVSTSMHTGVIGGCNVILLKPASKVGGWYSY
jgi:hypothetical protein